MEKSDVFMGSLGKTWEGNVNNKGVKNITFCLTEQCNLRCKYCYMTGKNNLKKLNFETAKKCVDYILNNRNIFNEGSVVWDFIGGEPFLEIELLDKLCDYIKLKMYLLDHPWFNSYMFSLSTNGILYNNDKVQEFIQKNKSHLSVGFSVDGNQIKHDLQRIYPDGTGSYKDVVKNVPLWLKQFSDAETKATFSHDDLPYLKDSIISLWNLGINTVAANVVFEDVWSDDDDLILEKQLNDLGDYILQNKLWNKYSVRFFDPSIGYPLDDNEKKQNFCGAGKMLAIDCDGNFYPCIRFLDFALTNKKGRNIGNINDGINEDKIRPFLALSLDTQSKNECIDCDVALGCAWCTGFNYDNSENNTIYDRATYICKMHKATVRANKKFWEKYELKTGLRSPRRKYSIRNLKYLQFIMDDMCFPYCNYKNLNSNNIMSDDTFKNGLKYANKNDFYIAIVKDNQIKLFDNYASYEDLNTAQHEIIPIYKINQDKYLKEYNCILKVNCNEINNILDNIKIISKYNKRINIILNNIDKINVKQLEEYKKQLDKLVEYIFDCYVNKNILEVNIITDRLYLNKACNCDAGINSFSVMPNGKIYICPAFYYDDLNSYIGDIYNGISSSYNNKLMKLENSPICTNCDAYHCKRCIYLNKKLTEEYNTPSKIQCLISNYERNASLKLQNKLLESNLIETKNIICKNNYLDPLNKIIFNNGGIVNE